MGGPFNPWNDRISPLTLPASTWRERNPEFVLWVNAAAQNSAVQRRKVLNRVFIGKNSC
jgi:hypothetical protein